MYTKKVGAKPDFADPVVLTSDRGGTTIEALCKQVSDCGLVADAALAPAYAGLASLRLLAAQPPFIPASSRDRFLRPRVLVA